MIIFKEIVYHEFTKIMYFFLQFFLNYIFYLTKVIRSIQKKCFKILTTTTFMFVSIAYYSLCNVLGNKCLLQKKVRFCS